MHPRETHHSGPLDEAYALDELTARVPSFQGASVCAPEPEETQVLIELTSRTGRTFYRSLVVEHNGDDVLSVRLPEGFRALAETIGIDPFGVYFEGYLETLARIAFRKMTGQ